jgi:ABC-2 type transport system permease protein/oleandomycin transport system permease protein
MTTLSVPVPPAEAVEDRPPTSAIIRDALTIAHRNLIALMRTPTTLVFSTVQPVIFVLMFRYVFGGAISVPGYKHYVDFLMPGIFVQTVCFGSVNTGIGLATDLQTGIIERFRSLPMARSAVLAGRTLADMVRNLFVIGLMVIVGFIVGFRIHRGIVPFLAAILLMLGLGFALSWVMALIGLTTGNAEAAQAASFPIMALVVFASNAFVDPRTMPGVLKAYARHQPVSATISAIRALTHGGRTAEPVLVALAWMAAVTVVFAALAVNRYRQAA